MNEPHPPSRPPTPPDPIRTRFAAAWEAGERPRLEDFLAEAPEARRPTLLLCYTRLLFTQALRRHMHDLLGYGLGMELLALGEKPEGPAR